MHIFTYFKEKLYAKRKTKSGLSFPISCKVFGVKMGNRQSLLLQSRAGDSLQIVHPKNKMYSRHVFVYSVPLNCLLGCVDDELADKLIRLFGKGFCRDGEIKKITGGAPYKYYGCVIRIFESKELMQDCENFSALHGE